MPSVHDIALSRAACSRATWQNRPAVLAVSSCGWVHSGNVAVVAVLELEVVMELELDVVVVTTLHARHRAGHVSRQNLFGNDVSQTSNLVATTASVHSARRCSSLSSCAGEHTGSIVVVVVVVAYVSVVVVVVVVGGTLHAWHRAGHFSRQNLFGNDVSQTSNLVAATASAHSARLCSSLSSCAREHTGSIVVVVVVVADGSVVVVAVVVGGTLSSKRA